MKLHIFITFQLISRITIKYLTSVFIKFCVYELIILLKRAQYKANCHWNKIHRHGKLFLLLFESKSYCKSVKTESWTFILISKIWNPSFSSLYRQNPTVFCIVKGYDIFSRWFIMILAWMNINLLLVASKSVLQTRKSHF